MSTKTVTLKELCKAKRIDPKTARRKLRNMGTKAPRPVTDARWVFPATKKAEVIGIITT